MPKTKKRERENQSEIGIDSDKHGVFIEGGLKKQKTATRRRANKTNKVQIIHIESDINQLLDATPILHKEEYIDFFDTGLDDRSEKYKSYLKSIENFKPMFINLYDIIRSYIHIEFSLATEKNKEQLSSNLKKLYTEIDIISKYANTCSDIFNKMYKNDTNNIRSLIDQSNVIMYVYELFFKETINIIEYYNKSYLIIDSNGDDVTKFIQDMKSKILNCIQSLRNELKYYKNNLKDISEDKTSSYVNTDSIFNDDFKKLSKRLFLKRVALLEKNINSVSLDNLVSSIQNSFFRIERLTDLFGQVQIADRNIEIQLVEINNDKDYLEKQFEDLNHNKCYLLTNNLYSIYALYSSNQELSEKDFIECSYIVNYTDQYIKFISLLDKLTKKIDSIETKINMNNTKSSFISFEQLFDSNSLNLLIYSPIANQQPVSSIQRSILNEEVDIEIENPSEKIKINVSRQWLPCKSTPESSAESGMLQKTDNKAKRSLHLQF